MTLPEQASCRPPCFYTLLISYKQTASTTEQVHFFPTSLPGCLTLFIFPLFASLCSYLTSMLQADLGLPPTSIRHCQNRWPLSHPRRHSRSVDVWPNPAEVDAPYARHFESSGQWIEHLSCNVEGGEGELVISDYYSIQC